MSGRVGLELTPRTVRVVRLAPVTGRVTASVEFPWDPARPGEAVSALRARLGRVDRIAIAVGLGFLEVAHADLPPLPGGERARIVELEPDRYFAAAGREPFAATVASDAPLAFGMSLAALDAWITAFEAWAPVERVEPVPVALLPTLRALPDASWLVEAAEGESGLVRLAGGRLVEARRSAAPVAGARPLPSAGGLAPAFAAALSVVRHAGTMPALAPPRWRARMASRRQATLVAAIATTVAALAFAGWAADRWRGRTLAALDARIDVLSVQVAPAEEALRRLASLEQEAATILHARANRADPLAALAAISAALPREASLLAARATGNHWQLDGTTVDASSLVPLLDRHPAFDSVRTLGATSRYREANRSYETFSLALRHRPSP